MPPRNTPSSSSASTLAAAHGMLEISGDINQPRQRFTREELRRPEFVDSTSVTGPLRARGPVVRRPSLYLLGTGSPDPEAPRRAHQPVRAPPGSRDC